MKTSYIELEGYGPLKVEYDPEDYKTELVVTNPEGEVLDLKLTGTFPQEQCVVRRRFERAKFNYDYGIRKLPEGLNYRVIFDTPYAGATKEFTVEVYDKDSDVVIIRSSPAMVLPNKKGDFGVLVAQILDELRIPVYNPLEFVDATN